MIKWLLNILSPKYECSNCRSKEWQKALWQEGKKNPLYCDVCPDKDGEDFRALSGSMDRLDKISKVKELGN